MSRFNGISHGQTCTLPVTLPDECPQQLARDFETWAAQLGAATEAELAQVEIAVYSRWRSSAARAGRGQRRRGNHRGDRRRPDDRAAAEVRDAVEALARDAEGAIRQLRNSTHGCDWLLGQWALISARLETHRSLEWSQRDYAIRLAGHRPADLFRNSAVMDWTRAYLGGLRGTGGFTPDEAANVLQKDVPEGMDAYEFERRLESVVRETPSIVEGHALLKGLIAAEVADLIERRDLIGLREGRDRARAIEVAKVDVSADGVKRTRYEAMSVRSLQSALRELRLLQESRRKYGEEGSDELSDQEPGEEVPVGDLAAAKRSHRAGAKRSHRGRGPGASEATVPAQSEATAVAAPAQSEATTVETARQNEATVTQVEGRARDNAAIAPVAAVARGPAPRTAIASSRT